MVRLVLDALGFEHELTIVKDADEAVAVLNRDPPFENATPPDLVVLGFRLSEIGAVAVLEEVKRQRTVRQRSILAVAGVRSEDAKSRRVAQLLGADVFLVKPARSEELRALASQLRQRWSRFTLRAALEPKTPCIREKF